MKIAVCGPYFSGKAHVVIRMGEFLGVPFDGLKEFKTQRYVELVQKYLNAEIRLVCPTGSLIYKESMAGFILENADCVVYVVSADEGGSLGDDEPNFLLYTEMARKLGKSWDSIPWILVLNKSDCGTDNPLLARFPPEISARVIRTNALTGDGIAELVGRIRALSRNAVKGMDR